MDERVIMDTSDIIQMMAIITTIAIFGIAHFISRNRDRVAANREIYQRLELASVELFRFEADHPELVRQLWEEDATIPEKDSVEEMILINFLCQYLNLFEMAYRLRKENIVPHEVFGSWVVWFLSLAEAPAFSRLWKEVKCDYVQGLVRTMDKALSILKEYSDEDRRRKEFFNYMSQSFKGCKAISQWHGISTHSAPPGKSNTKADPRSVIVVAHWNCTEAEAEEIADFMIPNMDTSYISHGEIMDGRALDESHWRPDLRDVLIQELRESYAQSDDPQTQDRFFHCKVRDENDQLIAIALNEIFRDSALPYAALHDMVIAEEHRGRGVGKQLLVGVEKVLREQKIRHIFIESGLHNDNAHHFFKRAGFQQTSTVSCKILD